MVFVAQGNKVFVRRVECESVRMMKNAMRLVAFYKCTFAVVFMVKCSLDFTFT